MTALRDEILGLRDIETAPQETLLDAHNNIRRLLAEADAKPDEPNEIRDHFAWRQQSDAIAKVMMARSIPFVPIDWT